jgi:hypothetical protein
MKSILLSALFSLITTLGFSQAPNYVPVNGLVGWWPFNGNADDESGNGNNGTVNGATLTTDRNGNVNSAYNFNNNTISLPNNASLGITPSGGQSIAIWAYLTGSQTTQHLLGKRGGNCFEYQIAFNYGNSEGLCYWVSGGGITSSYQIPLNQWVFIVGTYNTGTWKLYINQQLLATDNTSSSFITYPSCPLTFGNSGGFQGFIGKLDDIGMWNRALTECEIQNLYTSTIPTNTITTASACDSYLWNETNYTTSGVYTGPTSNCVTETLNLTITPSSTNTTTTSACNSYTWNGQTYTQSGVYTGTTANCVTESLDLTITTSSTITQPASLSTNISNNAQFIVGSSGSNAIYQWQTNLGFGFQNLNNAGQYNGTTSSTLSVINLSMSNNNQVFRCIISSGSCTDTSDLAVLTVVNNAGTNELSASKLSIYPNPTNGDFTITGLELVGTISSLNLTDMNGKVVKVLDTKATKFSMGSIKPGVYFLNIRSGNKQEVLKIVKE